MEEKTEAFTYTYSAKEQEEIKRIRDKYAPRTDEETSLARLRRLDKSATRGATALSLLVGIAGTLTLGVGMSCTLVWMDTLFVPGICIGLVGIAGVVAAYPVYTRLVKRKRAALAPEILRLSDALMR